jgi:hypothetical protein
MSDFKIIPSRCAECNPVIKVDGRCYKCEKKLDYRIFAADTSWDDVEGKYPNCDICELPSIRYDDCLGWENIVSVSYTWIDGCCDLDTQTDFNGELSGYACGGGGVYSSYTSGDVTGCADPNPLQEVVTIRGRDYFNDNPGENFADIRLHACWFEGNVGCGGVDVGDILMIVDTGLDIVQRVYNIAATNGGCCQNYIGSVRLFSSGALAFV